MRIQADIFNVIRQISSYLQETWFSSPSEQRSFDLFESKRHRGGHNKQVPSEFLTFFFICAFLFVIICLVSKQPKERNEEDEEEEEEEIERIESSASSMPVINETVTISSASSVRSVATSDNTCPDCDEMSLAPNGRMNDLIPALNFSMRDHQFRSLPDIPHSARSSSYASALSVVGDGPNNPPQVQLPQQQQQKKRGRPPKRQKHPQARATSCLEREWFVRRTRSGQIYGTYAF